MNRTLHLFLIIALFSCSPKTQKALPDWTLDSSEIIQYFDKTNEEIQVIHTNFHTKAFSFLDTTIIIKRFEDSLLLEEINYNLENGDSIKWFHQINKYSSEGNLIEQIDSMEGALSNWRLLFFEGNVLTRSEQLSVFPEYNDSMELIRTDSLKSINYNFYDHEGQCIKVMTLNRDELSLNLTGIIRFDTSFTFNQFDEFRHQIGSATLLRNDTTSFSKTTYDSLGQTIMIADVDLEFGYTLSMYEYDEQGNKISDLIIFDDSARQTKTEFDELGRPISRKNYSSNTVTNTLLAKVNSSK
jgi:hypothetical protein